MCKKRAKYSLRYRQGRKVARELTAGIGLVCVAGIGVGTTGIAGIGGSSCVGSSGVGLVLATLVWNRCNPLDAVGGVGPTMKFHKVRCVTPAGDMSKGTVLTMFAAFAFTDELVTNLLVVSHSRAGDDGREVGRFDESQAWVTGTRTIGEISPGVIGSVVAVAVVGVTVVGTTIVEPIGVVTVGAVLISFAGLGFLARILVVGRLAKLCPRTGFGVVGGKIVLVNGSIPFLKRHCDRLIQGGQNLAGLDVGLVDDISDERRRRGDDNHLTDNIVNVNENRMAQPCHIPSAKKLKPLLELVGR